MAKATLEYDLSDPDDVMEHKRAIKSLDMAMALWNIVHNTKKGLAHLILIIVDNGWIGVDLKKTLHGPYKDLFKRYDFISKEQTKNNHQNVYPAVCHPYPAAPFHSAPSKVMTRQVSILQTYSIIRSD